MDTKNISIILSIDFTKAGPILQQLYSPDPRGAKPRDPVKMLKAITVMVVEGYTSVTKWVEATRKDEIYSGLIGFKKEEMPGVGTYYDFFDRLVDGEYHKPCSHRVKKSSIEKGLHRRNLKKEKDAKKLEDDGRAKTVKLCEKLINETELPNPDDLQNRLQELLNKLAIEESIKRKLIDPANLETCGDGSCLETGASPHGKPICDCRKNGNYKCSCDRLYTDKTADWGYDSYREIYYFGDKFYQITTSNSRHDLALSISIYPASHTDFTMGMETYDRFIKSSRSLGITITKAVMDAGHDGIGVYEYFDKKGIKPAIALNPRTPSTKERNALSENGIPLCPAGLEMRFCSRDAKRRRQYFNCPVKRPTRRDGKYFFIAHPEECPFKHLCQPDTSMGPVAYVSEKADLRLHPVIRRGSDEYKRLMKLRSGVERSNNMKKDVYKLARTEHRRASIYLIKLYIISIIEHAHAWLMEDLKTNSLDQLSQHFLPLPQAA